MQIRITGGRLVDPGHFDGIADILIEDGKIAAIVESGQTGEQDRVSNIQQPGIQNFDASGKIVTPGLIDMHVHLREPGFEYKETIESGCRAAAHGGFSTICCKPRIPIRLMIADSLPNMSLQKQLKGNPDPTVDGGRIVYESSKKLKA